MDTVRAIFDRKDSFVYLPTGYGKSLMTSSLVMQAIVLMTLFIIKMCCDYPFHANYTHYTHVRRCQGQQIYLQQQLKDYHPLLLHCSVTQDEDTSIAVHYKRKPSWSKPCLFVLTAN